LFTHSKKSNYAVKDEETNRLLYKVYHKNEVDSMEDFEFMSKTDYVRLISQDEAFNILHDLGFMYNMESMDPAIGLTPMGRWYVDVHNPNCGLHFKAEAYNLHSAHLKAAYTAFLHSKNTQDYVIDLNEQGFISEDIQELGEDEDA